MAIKEILKVEKPYLQGKKEVLRVIKEDDNYFVYKNSNVNEHAMLDFIKRASDVNNLKCFIIEELEYVEYSKNIYSKFKLYKQGDLFSLIQNTIISKQVVDSIIKQLLSCVNYIHSLGLLHRDIKSENILIQDNGDILLCDFEFATFIGNNEYITDNVCGTRDYLSLEVILLEKYSRRTDIYACMIIFYEMLVKKVPFTFDQYNIDERSSIISDARRELKSDYIHSSLINDYNHTDTLNLSDIFKRTIFLDLFYIKNMYTFDELNEHEYFSTWDLTSYISPRQIDNEIGFINEYIESVKS